MIVITLNRPQFEYDIHSLVKAFYPAQEVKVFEEGTKEYESTAGLPEGKILFEKDSILFSICKHPENNSSRKITEAENHSQERLSVVDVEAKEHQAKKLPETDVEEKEHQSGKLPEMDVEAKEHQAKKLPEMDVEAKEHQAGKLPETDVEMERDCLEKRIYLEEEDDRKTIKCRLKHLIYSILSQYTGKVLPWGNLTGIRPTKIAYGLMEEGMSKEQVVEYMQNTYDCSLKKAQLSFDIASREKEILSKLHYREGYSLYLGIPFCPTTCLYCSFTSYPIGLWKETVEEYLSAMEKEIDYVSEVYKDKILDTVYIGGGTPTTLKPQELERLLAYIKSKFDFSTVQEFTVEAGRADSITREKLQVLKEFGVNRISVNPQTMKDETLRIIGRHHSVAQVREAFLLARETGFDNINMDLILGLPGETQDDVRYTVEEVMKLNPDSLTVHSLAVKRASKLNQWIMENGIETLHNTEETMKIAAQGALESGMKPYYLYRQKNMAGNLENIGYAKEGKYGIYNILIMEEVQTIIAIGAGTITKRVYPDGRIERCDNVKDVALYIEKIDEMIGRKKKLLGDS